VACEVLAVEPEQLLKFRWGEQWTITWRLRPEGRGTRLLLSHTGFDPQDEMQQRIRKIMDGGWRSVVMRRLGKVLEWSNAD
jgi:uncharacterized protein YndB with AHSA1/START domain